MKGYMISNGVVVMSEANNDRVIGQIMVNDEKKANLNIPSKLSNVIRLANVAHIIGAFSYATEHNCPVHIGQFGIFFNKGWHVTSFGEMDILNQMFAISYKA